MQPILCVGESYEERRKGIELDFAVGQVHDVTRDLSDEEASRLIVAYERYGPSAPEWWPLHNPLRTRPRRFGMIWLKLSARM